MVMITSLIGFVGLLIFGVYMAIRPAPPSPSDILARTSAAEIQSTVGINFMLATREDDPEYVATIRFELASGLTGTPDPDVGNLSETDEVMDTVPLASPTFAPVAGVIYCTPGAVGVDPCLDAWIAMGTPHELVNVPARWTATLPPSTTPFPTNTRSWFRTLPPISERTTPEPERTDFFAGVPEAEGRTRTGGSYERSE